MNEINNNKVNLCDSCSQVYPDCTSKPEDVYFGDGVGHDNICACSEYRPSAQPVRKTGQWIKRKKGAIGYNCSCCGKSDISNHFDYCPNCGADMRGEQDD